MEPRIPQAIISRLELEALIRDALAQCQRCMGADLSRIYMHEPDELGCNWMMKIGNAAHHHGCMEEMAPRIHHLRLHYKFPNPAKELAGHPT